MKKFLLLLLIFISLNTFAQIQVKEDSFRKIQGYVMLDKEEHIDMNNAPMALIKISTENISAEQRRKFKFYGNAITYFDVKFEHGEIHLYVSAAAATFIEIIHDEYGKTEYWLPETLCDYCGYEMVLQYIPLAEATIQNNYLIIKTDLSDARIFIDDTLVGKQFIHKQLAVGSTHKWKIECDLYHTESGEVEITAEENYIDLKMTPEYGFVNITSVPSGAKVYIDDNYVGDTPYKSDKMNIGNYAVRIEKDEYQTNERTIAINDKLTTEESFLLQSNYVDITIDTDKESDIYVDNVYKGRGRWVGKLLYGIHGIEARKANHRTINRNVELVVGEAMSITLNTPTPIYGMLEIGSNPTEARVYIDEKYYGQTPIQLSQIIIGDHELKLEKQGCASIIKNITIKEGETLSINEKLQTGKEITIKTDKSGDRIYVDGNYIGISPITSSLSFGSHEIKAERDGKTVSKNIEVSHVETHGCVSSDEYVLAFSSNETFTVKGVSFTMISVKGGTFKMGAQGKKTKRDNYDSDANDWEKPVHSVTLSDYYIGETEVTQELWEAVMGSNPSYFKGSQRPVEQVSWNECQEFIKKLNQLTGKNFRLPTEAEWEYAARGGNKSKGYKYSGSNSIGNVAWYYDNNSSRTHDVKTKQANELGIYDMSGNVYEWCQDRYGSYSSISQTNPTGSSSGVGRVYRGGSWIYSARSCRVSFRNFFYNPDSGSSSLGLRLCLSQY